jgi:hypothetical protein
MLVAMRFLLVHRPVVGPSTWRWVADSLRTTGHNASVPDLAAAAATGDPEVVVQQVAAACDPDEEIVVVGHSGAAALLPLIAAGLSSRPRLTVFVDAGVPPCEGQFRVGGDFLGALRELSTDGVLPIWSQWSGEGVLRALVPLDSRRHEIESELPRVPLSFYETVIEVPSDSCTKSIAYVLLSEAYREDARRASSLARLSRDTHACLIGAWGADPFCVVRCVVLCRASSRRRCRATQWRSRELGGEYVDVFDVRRRGQQLVGLLHERRGDGPVEVGLTTFGAGEDVEDAERRVVDLDREPRRGVRLALGQGQR